MIRVLVVGDEALIRTGFQRILDIGGGIEVVGAVSGGQALRRVRETLPDGGPPVLAAWKGHGPVPLEAGPPSAGHQAAALGDPL